VAAPPRAGDHPARDPRSQCGALARRQVVAARGCARTHDELGEPRTQLGILTSMRVRLERLRLRTNGYTVTPRQSAYTAYIALGALTLIVLSGAAVRLTGSGLGCPDWPKCYGNAYPPLNAHAVIEVSNRVLTAPVSLAAGASWLLALRRRPYRRDLMWLGALLPLGVSSQAVLGGF